MTARSSSPSTPISEKEIDELLAVLSPFEALVLAVSGGADSMALMHLVSRWRARRPDTLVVTVDHGLRPESGEEAAWVAAQAAKLGLPHATLAWRGTKPLTSIQQEAREARYQLLAERCRLLAGGRPGAVVTAHHRDDQAETFLMRLARGSGLDGLCGIARGRDLLRGQAGIALVRPLLGVAKFRLVAMLEAQGLGWIEDPSNDRPEFERVRVRQALLQLAGLGITAERIAESVSRLQRARQALERATIELERSAGLDLHRGAFAGFDRNGFLASPAELRLRLLARLLEAFGGQAEPPRLAKIESLLARLESAAWRGSSLGGCIISRHDGEIRVFREPGRAGLPEISLRPGERAIWDRRFIVRLSPHEREAAVVRALGAEGCARLADSERRDPALPARAAATLPAFWRGKTLIAAPQLCKEPAAGEAEREKETCTSEFIW